MSGRSTYLRFVVVDRTRSHVLMTATANRMRLPVTRLTGDVWPAEAVRTVTAARAVIGGDVVMLRTVVDTDHPASPERSCVVVVTPRHAPSAPAGMRWIPLSDLQPEIADVDAGGSGRPVTPGDAATAVEAVAAVTDPPADAVDVPWTEPAWFDAADAWLRSTLAALGRPVTDATRQVRVWDLSCVLCAPTADGDVYLKAVVDSPLFVNEGPVMHALARRLPKLVPAPLAVDGDRRWTLLGDVGPALGWSAAEDIRVGVARLWARAQVATADADDLLAAGCVDRRLDRLAAELERWLATLERTREFPGIDDDTWLTADEMATLRRATPQLLRLCELVADLPVPDGLVHGDLHLGNVAAGAAGYTVFDWTDACVAHPFFDMLTMLQATRDAPSRMRLRDAYLAEWHVVAPPDDVARTWQLAQPLGALHQAISYRCLVERMAPPVERHMRESTARWLREALAALRATDSGSASRQLASRTPTSARRRLSFDHSTNVGEGRHP